MNPKRFWNFAHQGSSSNLETIYLSHTQFIGLKWPSCKIRKSEQVSALFCTPSVTKWPLPTNILGLNLLLKRTESSCIICFGYVSLSIQHNTLR
jgi:hypothetical protein